METPPNIIFPDQTVFIPLNSTCLKRLLIVILKVTGIDLFKDENLLPFISKDDMLDIPAFAATSSVILLVGELLSVCR